MSERGPVGGTGEFRDLPMVPPLNQRKGVSVLLGPESSTGSDGIVAFNQPAPPTHDETVMIENSLCLEAGIGERT
jgi:hypothetical protein